MSGDLTPAAKSDRSFHLAENVIARGSKTIVEIPVLTEPDGTTIVIPILVVHGAEAGPVLNLSAGQHGDEYMAGEACRRLYQELDPARLKGTLVAAPCINVQAFKAGSRLTPDDRGDLNRVWPGRPDGTLTEQIAFSYLHQVVASCDYLLDFHDGGTWLAMEPLCGIDRVAETHLYRRSREMAILTGVPVLWADDPWPGSLPVEALRLGIPALTVESGADLDEPEAVVAGHLRMVRSLMCGLGMLPGAADAGGGSEQVCGKFARCTVRGLFKPCARRGAHVDRGDLIGVVVGTTGAVVEEVRAVASGRLLFLRRLSVVQPGERAYLIGEPVDPTSVNGGESV
ncbi:MAG: ethanolamine utilization protein EutE [Firmicutes bacterium]|nr:ethanolamine utilization protein EutE [Bacillota bacterium]